MNGNSLIGAMILACGFALGQYDELPALARAEAVDSDPIGPESRTFLVNLAEVEQLFALGERFKESHGASLRLSDGSERQIRLTPMLRDGELVVELRDAAERTFMGPNGYTYNGNLLINLRDVTAALPQAE